MSAPTTRAHAAQTRAALPVAATSLIAFAALYLVMVRTGTGQVVDLRAMWHLGELHPTLTYAARAALSLPALLALATVAGAGVVVQAARQGLRAAAVSVLVIVGTFVTAEVSKHGLTRPSFDGQAIINSFPSGHTAAIAGICAAAVVAAWRTSARGLVTVTAAFIAAGGGLATVILTWHRPSDAVASLLLATAWTGLGLSLTSRHEQS